MARSTWTSLTSSAQQSRWAELCSSHMLFACVAYVCHACPIVVLDMAANISLQSSSHHHSPLRSSCTGWLCWVLSVAGSMSALSAAYQAMHMQAASLKVVLMPYRTSGRGV